MASSTLVIFAEPDGWRLGVRARGGASSVVAVPVPRDATPDARAAALAAAMTDVGVAEAARDRAVLALDSGSCLCAPVATAGLPARQRGQALLYRLEEKLPVSAEEVSADFAPAAQDAATVLGVAVERRVLDPLVAAVGAAGARVAAVCPASLLALQQVIAQDGWPAGQPAQIVVWPAGPGGLELFVLAGDMPLG